MEYSCTTNYDKLYARGYYAHSAGSTSYDSTRLPSIIAALATNHGCSVLDIGGGNGALATSLKKHSIPALTLDAQDREDPHFVRFNLAHHSTEQTNRASGRITETLGSSYLATCFDVAEHIDIEHLADFLLNIRAIVDQALVLSVSTRPSSAANRYHVSILPVQTWQRLFALTGFKSEPCGELQALRSNHCFSGSDSNIAAVAYWQRRNPFRETHFSHQHYLLMTRDPDAPPLDVEAFRRAVSDLTDSSYRQTKRGMIATDELPILNYHVNFIQDWPFMRSLMDVWPAGRLRASIRRDIIAEPYLHLMEAFLQRTACPYHIGSTVHESMHAMELWGNLENATVMTATEGLQSVTHLMGSLLLLQARQRGASTICLQHGMTISRNLTPAAALLGAWDEDTAKAMRSLLPSDTGCEVMCTGSPKFLDALLPQSPATLRNRLGDFVTSFERVVLIGLNLHWNVHSHGPSETYQWIDRLTRENPETLFLIRPHPDDSTAYEASALFERSNIVMADEILLQCLDWPVARLLRACDGVITTYSTLVIDAAAAGKPVVLLPSSSSAQDPASFLPVSTPWRQGVAAIPVITADEWSSGALPKPIRAVATEHENPDPAWFDPSREFLPRLARATMAGRTGSAAAAEATLAKALMFATQRHRLDENPNPARKRVTEALSAFVSASPSSAAL